MLGAIPIAFCCWPAGRVGVCFGQRVFGIQKRNVPESSAFLQAGKFTEAIFPLFNVKTSHP